MRHRSPYKNPILSFAPTAISTVNLASNQTYTPLQSNTSIVGSNGHETVVIGSGIANLQIDPAVENIQLQGEFFNYYLLVMGSTLIIYGGARTLVAQVSPSDTGSQLTFADGTRLHCVSNGGWLSLSYEKLQLLPNMTTSAPNSNIDITGANGYETITIASAINNVRLDAAVDSVRLLGRAYDPALVSIGPAELVVSSSSGQRVVSLSLAPNQTHSLSFTNAMGLVTTDASGKGVFSLTDFYLGTNQSYTVNQNNLEIFGSRGKETVILAAGVSGSFIDSRVDKLVLPGAYSDYIWKTAVGEIQFYDAKNTLIAELNLPSKATGTEIQFADGTTTATYRYGVVSMNSPTGIGTTGSSAGTGSLQYTATYGDFGVYASGVKASLEAAMGKLGAYLNAKGSFDLQVLPRNVDSTILAEASGATVRTGIKQTASAFLIESVSGNDPNSSAYDATVYINLTNIDEMNLSPASATGASQYDLTSVLTHELLHAIGFNGTLGTSAGGTSPYDQLVSFMNGTPYFVGPAATTVYGGPVPLAPESSGDGSAYYHVDLPNDLMSSGISNGQTRNISKLDLAMLQDIGAPVLVGISTVA